MGKSTIHHTALVVSDINWYIKFFEEVFEMTIIQCEGDSANPNQVWFDGGIQLIKKPGVIECQIGHVGITSYSMDKQLALASNFGASTLPKGKNWIKLPDGLVLEFQDAIK